MPLTYTLLIWLDQNSFFPSLFLAHVVLGSIEKMTWQKHVCTNCHTLMEVQCSHFTDKKIKAERESQN